MKLITNNIFYTGVKDSGRKLFDQLIALEEGTTYNSYFIQGSEKNALVDTSYSKTIEEFLTNLNGENGKIDYIVQNHAEGDHSCAIQKVLELNPEAKIVTNAKCKELLVDQYEFSDDKFIVIQNEEELSLGDKTLKFYLTPWVHWPDTMFTHIIEDNVLFTCDFLGAHKVNNENEIYAKEDADYLKSAKKYYAEIMMPFRPHCQKYLQLIDDLAPDIICPSHGGIYKNPSFILNAYKEWTCDIPKNKVVLPFVSMYESTEHALDYLVKKLEEKGIEAKKFDIIEGQVCDYAVELIDSATVIFGASMVLANPHPYAFFGAYLTNVLRPKLKFMSIVGSYGWGGNLIGKMEEVTANLPVKKLDYVTFKGKAKQDSFEKLDELANQIASAHSEIGIR